MSLYRELTLEQHEFELCRLHICRLFCNKYIGKFFRDLQWVEKTGRQVTKPRNTEKNELCHECTKYMLILVYFIIYYHKIFTNVLWKLRFIKTSAHKHLQIIHGAICSQERCKWRCRCSVKANLCRANSGAYWAALTAP